MLILTVSILVYSCRHRQTTSPTSQTNQPNKSQVFLVGEGCDGCELIYDGLPLNINSVDTSPAWHEEGKKMLVQGTGLLVCTRNIILGKNIPNYK
jgi:protocatechuate 3,4-dioxygenase beta subunit